MDAVRKDLPGAGADSSKYRPSKLWRIAIAGIPNAGKTTLFNALTGLRYKVANYPGVTVEKREGRIQLPELGSATLIDLPGTYSLYGGAPEETLTAEYLAGLLKNDQRPDLVLCVIDACNLERNLYFASQLIDYGYPVIVALTMTDIAERRGIKIYRQRISQALGVPVLDASAHGGAGRLSKLEQRIEKELLAFESKKPDSAGLTPNFKWCSSKDFLLLANHLGQVYTSSAQVASAANTILGIGLLSGAIQSHESSLNEKILESQNILLQDFQIDPSSFEAECRYAWISGLMKRSVSLIDPHRKSRTEKIDRVITHKLWGMLIFATLMFSLFQSIFTFASIPMDYIDGFFSSMQSLAKQKLPPGQLQSLISDGIIAGVGSVLIFIPQIAILFFFISILEESGYLSRAAFLMDRVMRVFGLQGRSFIPMLNGFACAVPSILSTRTIPSYADRMVTIMVLPLMSCSARLPVYALLIAAFVPARRILGIFSLQGLVFFSLYLLGIIGAGLVAWLFKKTFFRGSPSHFVMEMPPYRLPQLSSILRNVWDRVLIFLKDAGSVILACSIVLWFLASYPRVENAHNPAEAIKQSYAGQFGQLIEPVIEPLGFDWKIGVGIFASFAAREVFVSSLALVHNIEDSDHTSDSLIEKLKNARNPITGEAAYGLATALSLLVFYVFASQCMSTLAACKRETGSWRWALIMFGYMTLLAYGAALITYQTSIRILS